MVVVQCEVEPVGIARGALAVVEILGQAALKGAREQSLCAQRRRRLRPREPQRRVDARRLLVGYALPAPEPDTLRAPEPVDHEDGGQSQGQRGVSIV